MGLPFGEPRGDKGPENAPRWRPGGFNGRKILATASPPPFKGVEGSSAPGHTATHSPQPTQELRAHQIRQSRRRFRLRAAPRVADDVIDLHFLRARRQRALDAGGKIHGDGRMRASAAGCTRRWKRGASTPMRLAQSSSSNPRAPPRPACRRRAVPAPSSAPPRHRARSAPAPACPLSARGSARRQARSPSISTTQARQLPSARKPSFQQRQDVDAHGAAPPGGCSPSPCIDLASRRG